MNKAMENIIELGVNLIIAVGVLMLISTVWNLGRDAVIAFEKQEMQEERAGELAEFSTMNGQTVEYARAVEIVTQYAGELDLYVDSTCDGGAILITSTTGCIGVSATEGWNTVTKSNMFSITRPDLRIGGLNTNYYTNSTRMIEEAKTLLASDLTAKFGAGKWRIRVAVNGEFVGTCNGSKVESHDVVTGLRLQRIQ